MTYSNPIFAAVIAIALAGPAAAASAQPAPEAPRVEEGRMLYSASGDGIAVVYAVAPTGEPRIILKGRIVTVPAATLSMSGRKLVTTLTRPELERLARR